MPSGELQYLLYANVTDIDHFGRARRPGSLPDDLAAIPEPRVGFVGVLSDFKVDFALILDVVRRRRDWSWVFIGEEREGQVSPLVNELRSEANTYFLGHKPYSALPEYLRGISVGTLPIMINDYTRSMFPMKYYEYLAAGVQWWATPWNSLGVMSRGSKWQPTLQPMKRPLLASWSASAHGRGGGRVCGKQHLGEPNDKNAGTDRNVAMRVLFNTYPMAFHTPGGGEIQLLAYQNICPIMAWKSLCLINGTLVLLSMTSCIFLLHRWFSALLRLRPKDWSAACHIIQLVDTEETKSRFPADEIRHQLSLADEWWSIPISSARRLREF